MSFNFIAWFFVGLSVYLVGLLVVGVVKYFLNKRKIKLEDKENSLNDEANNNENK